MNAAALERALGAEGLACSVEARGGLAIIVSTGEGSPFVDSERRRAVLKLARAHGFTHVAVELVEREPRAALPGD